VTAELPIAEDTAAIREQLARILEGEQFRAARRSSQFLEAVVEKTLSGERDEIKETVLAMEVFDRSFDYDPKSDSIVRVEAARVRAKLDRYYESAGARDPIRIRIPKGAYVPEFEPVAQPARPQPPEPRRLRWALAAASLAALCVLSWRASDARALPPADALTAWREGEALIAQDPLLASTGDGLPAPLARAIERLEFAVARAPRYAPAWASLAEAYDYAASFVGRDRDADADRAESAARRAISLDDRLPAGHAALAAILFGLRWDYPGAEASYRRAVELDSSNAQTIGEYADLLCVTGRGPEALETISRARRESPLSASLAAKHAEILAAMGDGEAAQSAAEAAVRLKRGYRRAHIALGLAFESRGFWSQAAAEYETALRIYPDDRRALPAYGYVLGRLGRMEEARGVAARIAELHRRVRNMSYQLAIVHMGLGERKTALHWLEAAAATRHRRTPFAAIDSRLQPLPRVSGSGTANPTTGG